MKKLVYAVAFVLAIGSGSSVFAQEPEKTDSTTVDKGNTSLALMQEPEKKDSTTVETPKEEVPASYAMAQEPEKKEKSEPTDSDKQEKSTCPDTKLV